MSSDSVSLSSNHPPRQLIIYSDAVGETDCRSHTVESQYSVSHSARYLAPEFSSSSSLISNDCDSLLFCNASSMEPVLPPVKTPLLEKKCLIGAIACRIQRIRTLDELVLAAVQELGHLLATDRIEIIQYLPEQQIWQHLADYRHDLRTAQLIKTSSDLSNPIAERLKRFEVVQVSHTGQALVDEGNPRLTHLVSPGSWILLPLQVEDCLWGSLNIAQQPGDWQSIHLTVFQAIADQIAFAIEHLQLHNRVSHLSVRLEQAVEQRTEQLCRTLATESMLKRITDKVRDSLDEDHILETLIEELTTLLRLTYCRIGLYDADHNTFTIAYEYPTQIPSIQGKTINIAAHAYEIYDQILCCQQVQFCLLQSDIYPTVTGQTVLACPIFDDQGILGDLWLFRPGGNPFNTLEVKLVQQVTHQCAIAIRQARLYQSSQHQVESLEHLNQLKDNFLSTISHELRTPISTMKMAIQMLTLTLGREGLLPDLNKPFLNSDKIAHYLKILNDECNREISLITDLLDMQQLEAGTHNLTVQSIELNSYLHRIVRPFQKQAEDQQQTLQIDIPVDLPMIVSDLQSLERILVELLTNAFKYTPPREKISLSTQVITGDCAIADVEKKPLFKSPAHRPAPYFLRINVTNTGVEIPPDQLGRVFDKFYRIPTNDPHRYGGTGLGLALVKKLTMRIGGRVFAESGEGKTSFTIEIPSCAT